MLSTDLSPSSAYADPAMSASRLIVTRRDPVNRTYSSVGYLDRRIDADEAAMYEFTYLARVNDEAGFVPIIGFRDLRRRYRSPRLFPSFSERVMSAKRPDRPQYLEALDLAADADAWEILTASGGHREGDPIELLSLPTFVPSTGATSACFLAHGVSHRGTETSTHIAGLVAGTELTLSTDPTNPVNPRAVQIMDGTVHLGFVPDPLVDYVHSILTDRTRRLTVVKANSAETHPHMRLLIRLDGFCSEFVFDRPQWRSA